MLRSRAKRRASVFAKWRRKAAIQSANARVRLVNRREKTTEKYPGSGIPQAGSYVSATFRKWRKAQTTVFMPVEAPKAKADAVRAAIKKAGGRVAS